MEALANNIENLQGFEHSGEYLGPTLILNGADSFQKEIQNGLKFYQRAFPRLKTD